MEVIINSIEELKEKSKNIENETYLKYSVNGNISYSIVMQKARLNAIGSIEMELNDIYQIFIIDNDFLRTDFFIPNTDLDYYLDLLFSMKNKSMIKTVLLLMKDQLKISDTIEFNNGKKGIIQYPKKEYCGQVYYRLLKKDGTEGKKELLLYRKTENYNYKCIDRDFVDVSIVEKYYEDKLFEQSKKQYRYPI